MKCRLFNFAAALSLLLCVAVCVFALALFFIAAGCTGEGRHAQPPVPATQPSPAVESLLKQDAVVTRYALLVGLPRDRFITAEQMLDAIDNIRRVLPSDHTVEFSKVYEGLADHPRSKRYIGFANIETPASWWLREKPISQLVAVYEHAGLDVIGVGRTTTRVVTVSIPINAETFHFHAGKPGTFDHDELALMLPGLARLFERPKRVYGLPCRSGEPRTIMKRLLDLSHDRGGQLNARALLTRGERFEFSNTGHTPGNVALRWARATQWRIEVDMEGERFEATDASIEEVKHE